MADPKVLREIQDHATETTEMCWQSGFSSTGAAARWAAKHEGNLIEALEEARSVIGSLNSGKHFEVTKFGERGYWQRFEWVEWAMNEVLPKLDAALEAVKQPPLRGG